MPFTPFTPSQHGFHFPNAFTNHFLFNLITTHGLCGGMSYAALDYFYAGIPIPTHRAGDFGSATSQVPPEGTRLADYILGRQVDSIFNELDVWGNVVINPFFNPVKFTNRHLADLLSSIDLGRPVPLGLIAGTTLSEATSNHQVVAYGYEIDQSAQTLQVFIYDNRFPDTVLVLTTNPNNPEAIGYTALNSSVQLDRWIAFFVEANYKPHTPTYIDLGLSDGVDLTTTGPSIQLPPVTLPVHIPVLLHPITLHLQEVGKPLTATCTVQNFGDFQAHMTSLNFHVLGPDGEDESSLLGGDVHTAPLAPGQTLQLTKTSQGFGSEVGSYQIRAQYTSASPRPADRFALDLPAQGTGTRNPVSLDVVAVGTRMRSLPIHTQVATK